MTGGAVDVAVVGAGPVGMAAAVLLAQRGRTVTVLERWPEPYPLPRAVHFDHEVGRLLQGCGIGPALAGASEPAEVYEWRNGAGTTLLRFGRIGAGTCGWPESSMFHQPTLEALLGERAAALPSIEVRRGVEVTGIDQRDGAAMVTGTGPGGEPVAVTARWVLGCDGANSTVRRLVDAPVTDLGFFYDWLIVDVILHDGRRFDPINVQVCDPARPTTAVSGGPGRRRWEFMRLPHEDRADLDTEARAWALLADWDVHPGNATLERHAVYTFNARYADRWRTDRVLLAGDAAHLMPPFAGQGLCSGIRDAANLAWKLDLVLGGHAPDELLDSYQGERAADVRAAIGLSMDLGKVICVPDPDEAAARDAAMSAAVGPALTAAPEHPPITDGIVRAGDAGAGAPFVQGTVAVDGASGRFDDLLGLDWRLVTVAPSDGHPAAVLDADDRTWFADLGGRVVALGPTTPGTDGVTDVDGTYARWFADRSVTWALQRPDGRVFGTAADAAGAAGLLADLRHRLTPVPTTQGGRP